MSSSIEAHATIRNDADTTVDVYDALAMPGHIVVVVMEGANHEAAAIVLNREERAALIEALQTCPDGAE